MANRLRFTADFDFSPQARRGMVTLAYKAGDEAVVTRECAEKALAAGKAVRMTMRRKRRGDGKQADSG